MRMKSATASIGEILCCKPLILILLLLTFVGCGSSSSPSSEKGDNSSGIIKGTVTATSSAVFKVKPPLLKTAFAGDTGVSGAVCILEGTDNSATTDANGLFQMNGVPPGSYILICKKTATDGKVYAFLEIIEVQGGETVDLEAVEIKKTGSIQGKATLADQVDHTGISVYIPGTSMQARTDASGAYLINDVPEGTYELRFEKSGYMTGKFIGISVTAGETALPEDITLSLSTGASGIISIENGKVFSNSRTVTVYITASADARLYQMSDNPNFVGEVWNAIPPSRTWVFESDGEKRLYIKFADANGLESAPVSDTIIIDTAPPINGIISINNGASATNSTTVTLNLSATDVTTSVSQMMISNNPDSTNAEWESFANTRSWAIPTGDGVKTVYVKYKDIVGNEATRAISDSIILDTTLPINPSISIQEGAYTNNPLVHLNLTAVGATYMKTSEDAGFTSTPAIPFSSTTLFTLSTGDGNKTIYAKFIDDAGNETNPVSASIILDTTPPTTPVIFNQNQTTNQTTFTMTLITSSTDTNFKTYQLKGGQYSDWTDTTETTIFNFTLSQQGANTLSIRGKDLAGNVSNAASVIVTLDTVSPVLSNIKTSVTGTTANISWQTNESTTGQVNFGLNQNYGNSQTDSSLTTNHAVLLTGLFPQTLYHYQIISIDTTGNTSISTDLTFKTAYDLIVNPNISVNIAQPAQGAIAGTPLLVAVTVNSFYELKDVKARVEGIEANLSFSSNAVCTKWGCGPGWAGSIPLTGLERGEKLLIVKATDVFGNITEATRSFIFDQKPVLSVADPLDRTVARPQLHISASCTDDDPVGCTSVTVKVDGTVVTTGQSSIDENVSLASFDGRQVTLRFEAKDSANQVTTADRVIYVEASSMLTEVETMSGSIFDVQPDRILFLDKAGSDPILKIRNRVTGEDTLIPSIPGKLPRYGFLSPKGAIFAATDNDYRLFEWIGNAFATIDFPTNNNLVRGSNSLKVRGNYAIWNLEKVLSFRDLLSGTDTIVSDNTAWEGADVADNGDVVYSLYSICGFDCNIYRYRKGIITRLTNDLGGPTIGYSFHNRNPLTDGINVIYSKKSPPSSGDTYAIAMYGIAGEEIISPARPQEPSPGFDYQLNNGWISFTKPGSGGELQIWVRSPSGQENQITYWGTSSRIGALSPSGEVTFINGNRMYLSGPGLTMIEIGSSLGRSFWQNGQWYIIIGRSLFSISR